MEDTVETEVKQEEIEVKQEKTEVKKEETKVKKEETEIKQEQIEVKQEETQEKTEIKQEDTKVKPEDNPYAYLEKDFSSENYKIEVKNLPRFYGINEFKKLLNEKLQLGTNKIKLPRKNNPFIFVCFRSDEERDKAIATINEYKWKGKALIAFKAKPSPDPLVKRRRDIEENLPNKKVKVDNRPAIEQLRDSTIPLWNLDYQAQLEKKQEHVKGILTKLGNDLSRQNIHLQDWIKSQKDKYNGLPCELLNIRHADKTEGYRNKCEFTVGINEETKLPTVGFRVGSYAKGATGVGPIQDLIHIPDSMKLAVKYYEEFVRSSDLKVYDPESQTGHFRQLLARSAKDQLMLVFGIHPQDLDEQTIGKFKEDVVAYFKEGAGSEAKVTSMYYQAVTKRVSGEEVKMEHLHGDQYIYETIHGLKFRISPQAFFQVNSAAAEVLYHSAIELAEPTHKSTVVDICCGTGTIGLCFAKSCDHVLGLELVPQAVHDANENAKLNNIENAEFFVGKAEEILTSVCYRSRNDDVIGVVDPPRAGLHHKAVNLLRKVKNLKKLVYISCNPNAAYQNFVDLGRPMSKTMQQEAFVPIKAVATDMCPYTNHIELVIFFQRWDTIEENKADDDS